MTVSIWWTDLETVTVGVPRGLSPRRRGGRGGKCAAGGIAAGGVDVGVVLSETTSGNKSQRPHATRCGVRVLQTVDEVVHSVT